MFCPFRTQNFSTDCVGLKCMWYMYEHDKCAMLVLAENNTSVKKTTIDLGEGVVYSDLVNK